MREDDIASSFEYLRTYRIMPWIKRGLRVEMNGKKGRVTSGNGGYVRVRFDGQTSSVNCHPHWRTVYYDEDGAIIADYRPISS